MTGLLWVLLAASMGLAAVVTRADRTTVELDIRKSFGEVAVMMPHGWTVTRTGGLLEPATLLAVEPKRNGMGRRITVRIGLPNTLEIDEVIGRALIEHGVTDVRQPPEPIDVAGRPGLIASGIGGLMMEELGWTSGVGVVCAALPSGRTLTVTLESLRAGPQEMRLLRQVVAGIQLQSTPASRPAGKP